MKSDDITRENKAVADHGVAAIDDAFMTAKVIMRSSLLAAVLAGLRALLLMRAIMAPMNRIAEILELMRTGDLRGRLSLAGKDELGAVETGFRSHHDCWRFSANDYTRQQSWYRHPSGDRT